MFVLAFHVDYWNVLGHQDPFSAARFTDRQRWYAEGWGTTRAYTPQMIIGGTRDIAGNDTRSVAMAISRELDAEARVGIAVRAEATGEEFLIRYVVEPPHARDFLTLALVQDSGSTRVRAGANAGRILSHVNIVRDVALSHVGSGRGTWGVEIPEDMPSGCVAAYVQHAHSRRVLGASWLRLIPSRP